VKSPTRTERNGRGKASGQGVNLDLLKRLSETPGVSGREEQVRAR
jgi:hypothetical protein